MTKTIQEKEKFIQLRAQGLSFDKIAEELNISKNTLLGWSGEFFEEVKEAQFTEYENLLNEYQVHRTKRFEQNCKLLNACYEELEKKLERLEKLSVPELAKLTETLEKRIAEEASRSAIPVEKPSRFSVGGFTEYIEF